MAEAAGITTDNGSRAEIRNSRVLSDDWGVLTK